jgi:hypothetical protein
MVDTSGECESLQTQRFNHSKDYRNAVDAQLVITSVQRSSVRMDATQLWQFPSGTVMYCSANDTACSLCTRTNFWRLNSTAPDSRFCLGDDGACVCVDICERRYIQDDCGGSNLTATTTRLPALGSSEPTSTMTGDIWRGIVGTVASVIVLIVIVRRRFAADRNLIRMQEEARFMRRHARSHELGLNILSLSGWETYRRSLIDKETAQLASTEEESKAGETEGAVVYARRDRRASNNASTRPVSLANVARRVETIPAVITRQQLAPLTTDGRTG